MLTFFSAAFCNAPMHRQPLCITWQVTSAGAAEMIAVSTILSYDLYKGYFRRNAQGMHQILGMNCVMQSLGAYNLSLF